MNEQKKPALAKSEPVKSTVSKKGGKGAGKGGTGRGKGDQEAKEEKGKASEEEGEEEGPLEVAVRQVVSYRMTPKQALAEYKLTPKVIFAEFCLGMTIVVTQVLFDHLLGETDSDRLAILGKVKSLV